MQNYLNLQIGAKRRLEILKRDYAEWMKKRPQSTMKSWRGMRFSTFKSQSGLGQRANTWYCQDGPQFRNEHVCNQDWYCDVHRENTARGIVAMLPHGRFIAGYLEYDNDERVYFPGVFDDEKDAARMADEHARVFAEIAMRDSEKCEAAYKLDYEILKNLNRLRDCLVLRHVKCMDYVKSEITDLIESIRQARELLKTEYREYL